MLIFYDIKLIFRTEAVFLRLVTDGFAKLFLVKAYYNQLYRLQIKN